MIATDTLPDTELVDSCNVTGRRAIGETYYAVCTLHNCAQIERYPHRRQALHEFVCDRGEGWRFILQYEAAAPPVMVDLSGLVVRVEGDQIAAHLGHDDGSPAKIWRWTADGETEPVTVTHVKGSGEWVRNPTDEAPATAYPEYVVTGPDGTEFARVVVTLDEV